MYSIPKRRVLLSLLILLLLASSAPAGDQIPFKGTVVGQVVSATPQDATHLIFEVIVSGKSTELGRFSGEAQVIQNIADGSYTGTYTWRAANGDTVFGTFAGQLIPTDAPDILDNLETSVITGGTGRFEGVSGSASFGGQLNATTQSFVYPFEGTMSGIGSNE